MPCCICGFDKKIVSSITASKKIFFLHYPGEKNNLWTKWNDSIQKFKPDFQPPRKGGVVCSQHFVDDNTIPTVISNQILPPESNRNHVKDMRLSIPPRMSYTQIKNGLSTNHCPSATSFESDHMYHKTLPTRDNLKLNLNPFLKLTRCKEPSSRGIMCMDHWNRNCFCLSKVVQYPAPKKNFPEAQKIVTPLLTCVPGPSGENESTNHITVSLPEKRTVQEAKANMTHKTANVPRNEIQPLRVSTPKPTRPPPIAKTTVELSALLNNRQLMSELIKEVSTTDPNEPLDLKKCAVNLRKTKEINQRYLLVDWKRFHRNYQEGKLHIRIRFNSVDKNGVFIVYVLPVDARCNPLNSEDIASEDIRNLVGQPNLPVIVKELLKPSIQPIRLKNKYFAALHLCPGSNYRWKLMSCIHMMMPVGYGEASKVLIPSATPSPSTFSISFPSVEACKLIRKESLYWKVTFDIPMRPNQKVAVLLPLPASFNNPDLLQWWLLSTTSIPERGLSVIGLTEDKTKKTLIIPPPLLKKTALASVEQGVSTFLRLEPHFKQISPFLTPCCLYGWPKLSGFVIMGPLPAHCPLPAGSPWIIRIPLADKNRSLENPPYANTNGVNGFHLQAEEVLLVRHDVFLPGGRIFESVETAQQWILTLTEALNLPGSFQCHLNDTDSFLPPLEVAPSIIDEEKFGMVEKIPLGTISWMTGTINIPIVGRKLIRVRHSLPTTTGVNYSLFRTSKEVEDWAQSVQGFISNRRGDVSSSSLPEPNDPLILEPIVQIDSADDEVIFDILSANGSLNKRARYD